jgi:acyl-[acyl-carrier-protein]-phospholipid O-acyltransferase / long-chain-fatty-acid--[acyl-carrier-protein] ligase
MSKPANTPLPDQHISPGTLLIPNSLRPEDIQPILTSLGAHRITCFADPTWPVHGDLRSSIDLAGLSLLEPPPNSLTSELRRAAETGSLCLFVPGRAALRPGAVSSVPLPLLRTLLSSGLPIAPLYCHDPSSLHIIPGHPRPSRPIQAITPALPPAAASVAAFLEGLFLGAERTFQQQPGLDAHLATCLLHGLKSYPDARIIDGIDGSSLSFRKLLAVSLALAAHLSTISSSPRVGIVLPPGKGGFVANLATLLAGKVPVNLNFTAGPAAIRSCFAQAGLDLILTSARLRKKVPDFPWVHAPRTLDLEQALPPLKPTILRWLILSSLLPAKVLARKIGLPNKGGDAEASLLFTSGSSGDPKGVSLSHRNILANVTQFGGRIGLARSSNDRILATLPLFHSFGATVTLFYPLLAGLDVITYPTPLEARRIAELIDQHRATLLVSTPTFLRGYLKRATRDQLAPLRLVVTGAEKLSQDIADAFENRFGKPVLEGYGLTETSPATNVNLPPLLAPEGGVAPETHRRGSVGQMLPGIAVKLRHPETGEHSPLDKGGIVCLKGANIFSGYLDLPQKSSEVLDQEGWFITGDLGRVDEDGFLFIEGRLSRFSKIGGEMVPHETVEDAVARALEIHDADERLVAITAIPDPNKGEALVLLSAIPTDDPDSWLSDLQSQLRASGLPALWIPRSLRHVPAIPTLASGKLDLKACQQQALLIAENG